MQKSNSENLTQTNLRYTIKAKPIYNHQSFTGEMIKRILTDFDFTMKRILWMAVVRLQKLRINKVLMFSVDLIAFGAFNF